jgi:histidine ammonia-lyase
MTAALKFVQITGNVATILAIELMCAAQAIEFLKPLRPGPLLAEVYRRVRQSVPALDQDEPLSDYIAALIPLIHQLDAILFGQSP